MIKNELRLMGWRVIYYQKVTDIAFKEIQGEYAAEVINPSSELKTYQLFDPETWMDKKGILKEISLISKERTSLNERELFEKFIRKWGLIHNNKIQLMNEFWGEIDKIALLLERYAQVRGKQLKELKEWIELTQPRQEITRKIDTKTYNIINSETLAARRGTKTLVDFKGLHKVGQFEFDQSINYFNENEIASYQLFGFLYLTGVLDLTRISAFINTGKLIIKQENPFRSIDNLEAELSLGIKNMKDAIYVLLYIIVTKKYKVCICCQVPFDPTRADSKYCSETCKNRLKKQRYRKRKKSD